jgi:uncharacterized membrane protein
METFLKLVKTLWVIITIFAIGWAALPFILAASLDLGWINWFGILTVPSGIVWIVIMAMQRKVLKDAKDF